MITWVGESLVSPKRWSLGTAVGTCKYSIIQCNLQGCWLIFEDRLKSQGVILHIRPWLHDLEGLKPFLKMAVWAGNNAY